MLQIVVHKQLSRVGIELATFGLLEKRLDLSPREVHCFFFNCIDTYISTYQLAGDTFIMNKYLNGIVTTIYNCYIVGIKGCYIK